MFHILNIEIISFCVLNICFSSQGSDSHSCDGVQETHGRLQRALRRFECGRQGDGQSIQTRIQRRHSSSTGSAVQAIQEKA